MLWLVIAVGLILVIVMFGLLVWLVAHHVSQAKVARDLAQYFKWRPLTNAPSASKQWFGGNFAGRRVAIRSAPVVLPSDGSGSIRSVWVLRIALQPEVARPLSLDVSFVYGHTAEAFAEERLTGRGAERLSVRLRASMIAFVARRKMPDSVAVRERAVPLRVADRTCLERMVVAADVWPDASVTLIHECAEQTVTPDALLDILTDLSAVAEGVELWAASLSPDAATGATV